MVFLPGMFPMRSEEAGSVEPQAKPLKIKNKAMRDRKIDLAIAQFVEFLDWRAIWLTLYKSMTTLKNTCPRLSQNLNGDCRRSNYKDGKDARFVLGGPPSRALRFEFGLSHKT
jgi:hypothetical protein